MADRPGAMSPQAQSDTSDRVFTLAFAISLGIHLILILGQFLSFDWLKAPRLRAPLQVVYDSAVAQQDLQDLKERLSRAKSETAASPAPPTLTEQAHIRIPDRPSLTATNMLADLVPQHAPIVDLTNLVDASRGDPVLLSYFSAIREQIQQAANGRPWLSSAPAQGLVYVSFELTSSGVIRGVTIIPNRSIPSNTLQDVAVEIIKAAAPFPPFPPSMVDPSKTIVVPLEFLVGS